MLWIDAHSDINTPETSPSGNVHGMPLAAALGLASEFESEAWTLPAVDPSRVALIGTRQLDAGERLLLREAGVRVYTMSEIDRVGIERAVRESLDRVAGGGFVHVSFDMDVLDPAVAPGVGTPVRGGLTYREAHLALELVAESGLAGSLEMVEVNPILDRENTTALTAVELVASALGKTIYWGQAEARPPRTASTTCARPGTSSDPSSATYFASRRSAPSRIACRSSGVERSRRVVSIRDRSVIASHHASNESACERRAHFLEHLDSETRLGHETPELVRVGQAKRAGCVRIGPFHETELERRPRGCGHPVVLVRGRPDRDRGTPSGSQYAGDLGERTSRVRHEHDPEAADDAVDRAVANADRRCILDPELDVRDLELCGSAASGVDHLGRDVGREQEPVRPEPLRGDEARISGAGRELEHRVARRRVEQGDESLVQLAGHLTAACRLALPACSGRSPGLDLLVVGCRYVVTCANCGMMSRP